MTTFEAWIGTCHIRGTEGFEERSFECFLAVWAQGRENFEATLRQHLKNQSQNLLWAEEVFPVIQWLSKHGHNQTVMRLARSVHNGKPVQLGAFTKLGANGEPAPPP